MATKKHHLWRLPHADAAADSVLVKCGVEIIIETSFSLEFQPHTFIYLIFFTSTSALSPPLPLIKHICNADKKGKKLIHFLYFWNKGNRRGFCSHKSMHQTVWFHLSLWLWNTEQQSDVIVAYMCVSDLHAQAGRRSGLVKMEQIQTQQSNHPFSSSIIHWLSTLWSKRLWSIVRTQREAGENWRLRRIDMWNHKETWRKVSDRWWRCKPFSNKSKPTGLRQAYQQFFFSWKIWMPSAPMQQMSLPILQSLNLSWPI